VVGWPAAYSGRLEIDVLGLPHSLFLVRVRVLQCALGFTAAATGRQRFPGGQHGLDNERVLQETPRQLTLTEV